MQETGASVEIKRNILAAYGRPVYVIHVESVCMWIM